MQLQSTMHLVRLLCTLLVTALLSACVTPSAEPPSLANPELIAKLPDSVESFDYQGFRYFKEPTDGYTFRYVNPRKQRLADVFVYPVAEQNKELAHDQLVMGSTRATLDAIGTAVQQGLYANFAVIGAATQARGYRTVARVEATYLRENLASYTLVYQTEYDGTFVKIRLSMPDNESNRSSQEWDRFAKSMFDTVIETLNQSQLEAITKHSATGKKA